MKEIIPQSYKNHRSFDWVHIIATATLLPAILVACLTLLPIISQDMALTIIKLLLIYFGACLLVLAIKIRRYPLVLQDRIIRLEMRLRLERLLPHDDHWQINGLTTDQVVALRFASDEELPTLVRKVLDEKITNRDQIKQMIQYWTPDRNRI